MEEHRGQHRVKLFEENRKAVIKWLMENPDKPMKQCSIDLGLSYLTTRKHIKSVLNEK